MLVRSRHTSCCLTAADHARLGLLRDRCRGLIDRAHGSVDRSAALLRRLPRHPAVPDWPGSQLDPAMADEDVAELWVSVCAASRAAQAVVERAAREVAQSAFGVARARELRHESRILRWAHAALGPLPPPAPATGAEGETHRPAWPEG